MSDCLGMCFLMTDSGVSTGTSGWDYFVYSISRGWMVLKACISKSRCFSGLLTVFSFATVNLSDFSHSMLILLTNSLEAMSLLGILIVLWGCAVQVVAAVMHFKFEFEFSNFDLGGLLHFLYTHMNICLKSISVNHNVAPKLFIKHSSFQ